MSFKTLDQPGLVCMTKLPIRENGVFIDEQSVFGKWLSRVYSILQRAAPLVVNNAFYIDLSQIPVYANNAAAIAGGLSAGNLYRTGANPDPVCVVH